MKNKARRFINMFLILIISLHCIVPVPAVIAQDLSDDASESAGVDVVIANINAANTGSDPYGFENYIADTTGWGSTDTYSAPAYEPAPVYEPAPAYEAPAPVYEAPAADTSSAAVPAADTGTAAASAEGAVSDFAGADTAAADAGTVESVPADSGSAQPGAAADTGTAAADTGSDTAADAGESNAETQTDGNVTAPETAPAGETAEGPEGTVSAETTENTEDPAAQTAEETDGEPSAADGDEAAADGALSGSDDGETGETGQPALTRGGSDDAAGDTGSEEPSADENGSTEDADADSADADDADADAADDADAGDTDADGADSDADKADGDEAEDADEKKEIRVNKDDIEGEWAEILMGYEGDDIVRLDFDGVPAAVKAILDADGVYNVTFLIPEGFESELVNLDLAELYNQINYLSGFSSSNVLQPGDIRTIRIWIKNTSGHVYRYKDQSFVLQTPTQDQDNIPEDPEKQAVAFDDQTLDKTYLGVPSFEVSLRVPAITEKLLEYGVSQSDINYGRLSIYDTNRFFNKLRAAYGGSTNSEAVINYLLDYYSKKDGREDDPYTDFVEMLRESPDADEEIRHTSMTYQGCPLGNIFVPQPRENDYNTAYEDGFRWVYGEDDVREATDDLNGVRYQYATREVYSVVDYGENPPTEHKDCVPLGQVESTYYRNQIKNIVKRYFPDWSDDEVNDVLVEMSDKGISFLFESEPDENGETHILTASNSQDGKRVVVTRHAEYGNDRKYSAWELQDGFVSDSSIGDYMKDRLDEAGEGAWDRANEYFNFLLGQGIGSKDAAAWASFMMAGNLDYIRFNNNMQDTAWNMENWITLERIDGDVMISKVDSETGEVIDDSQTAFRLWYYDNTSGTNEKYYYTQATDPDTGEVKNLGFVHYDPDNSAMNYTIDIRTTNGELNIDKTLLEGTIYYLKETVAPENYELDTTVYIICDSDEQVQAAKEALSQDNDISVEEVENAARIADENGVYRGVDSNSVLKISFANTRIVTPPEPGPEPTPGPDPSPTPEVPYQPVIERIIVPETILHITTIEEYNVPLAGLITMNEGDCFD